MEPEGRNIVTEVDETIMSLCEIIRETNILYVEPSMVDALANLVKARACL